MEDSQLVRGAIFVDQGRIADVRDVLAIAALTIFIISYISRQSKS